MHSERRLVRAGPVAGEPSVWRDLFWRPPRAGSYHCRVSIRRTLLSLLLASLACTSPEPAAITIEDGSERPTSYASVVFRPAAIPVVVERASLDVPDSCDRLLVIDTPSGPQLSKEIPPWLGKTATRAEQQAEIRELIDVVGDELGVDEISRELLYRKAILESSGNPGAVHVRSGDIEANRRAASRGRKASSERWADARVSVHKRQRGRMVVVGSRDAWALGRGLYGSVTGLHVQRWGTDVPPWSLCDPIIATVTTIWSMRAGLAECRGRTLRDAYRRFSSGRCPVREAGRERVFDQIARGHVRGLKLRRIDADAPADFGSLWPEETTDRGVLLAKLRSRLAARLAEKAAG
jgi:hypothetical protein